MTKSLEGLVRSKVIETVVYSYSFSLVTVQPGEQTKVVKDFVLTPKVLDLVADGIERKDFN